MFLRVAATFLLAALLHVAPGSAQEVPPDFDEGIFQVHTTRLRAQPLSLLTLVSPGGEIFLPLAPVLDYLGIPTQTSDGELRLEWPPPAWLTHLRLDGGEVRRPDRTFQLHEGSILRRGAEWYIAVPALERLLEIRADVIWETLSVQLSAPVHFPAERLLTIEAQRQRFREPEFDPELLSVGYTSRTGGIGFDWSLAGTASSRSHMLGGSLAAGVGLLGGSLEAGGTAALHDDRLDLGGEPFVRYARNFPGNPLVQQLELGHVRSEGPLPLPLFGFRITNEPFVQPRLLGSIVVHPVLPSGWEYEVYEGGQLVGIGTDDPGDGVEAPLRYGATPLTVRMLGPAGQERTEEMVLLLPVTRVPPGAVRYFLGAGECRTASCSAYAAGELRFGLHPRLTAGAGVDALTGSAADGLRPHLAISANPFWTLIMELQARPGFVNASLQHQGGQRRNYSARLLWSDEDHPFGGVSGWRLDVTGHQELPRFLGGRWMSARLNLRADSARQLTGGQGSVGVPVRGGFIFIRHESGLQQTPVTSLRLYRSLRVGLPSPIGLGVSAGLERGGLGLLETSLSVPISQRMAANAQLQWRPEQRPLLSVGYSARFGAALAQLRGSALRGTPTVSGSLRGGAAFSGRVGGIGTPYGAVNRAGITGRVFLDRDGSGSFSPGVDLPLEDVEVRAAGRLMRTDAEGIYRGWDLQPYVVTVVAIDTVRLRDPDFAPRTPYVLLRPSPNLFNRADIPLVRTREVMGRLMQGEGVGSVGGVSIEIVNKASGDLTNVRTFADGEFYVSRLLPGDYEVRVAESSLRALNATSQPGILAVHVPAAGEETGLTLPPIRIERSDTENGGVRERVAVPPVEEAAPPPPPPVTPLAPTRLHGTVRDTGTGLPVTARVLAVPADGVTVIEAIADPGSGGFTLDLHPGTTYILQVGAPGYAPESLALDLTEAAGGGVLTAEIGLTSLPVEPPVSPARDLVRLDGSIRDTDTGRPLAARVMAVPAEGGPTVEATSEGLSGRFSLELHTGARYTIHISAPGYAPEQAELDLTARPANDVLIVNAGLRRLP